MSTDVAKFSTGYQGKKRNRIAEHEGRTPQPGVPSGSRNTPPPITVASSTVATVSPTGTVTATSPTAARRAVASKRRSRRIARASARHERKVATTALAQVAASRSKRASERAGAPRPSSYLGRKTAGAPTKSELDEAHATGTLEVNKAGAVTTPAIRQTSRRLNRAALAAARSTGVTGPLTAAQKRIAEQVARETGLKPKTVATQELQEESGSAARKRDAERNFDVLNIGYADSGPMALTGGSEWSSPRSAAKATSDFFKGRRYGPSPAIAAILPQARGKSAAEQLAIIGNSGWATSDYAPALAATSQLVGERSNPKAKKRLVAATKAAKELGLKPKAVTGTHVGPAPRKLVKRTVIAEHAMREIEGQPYVWGGGHGSFTEYGKDCSGAVSYVLHKVEPGRLKTPLTSGDMGEVLEPGPGALTVFYNADHTFLRLINRRGEAEYWGTSVGDSGAGGLTRHPTPSKSYLAQYNVGHVPGMGKLQALQLGADPAAVTGGGSYAGMSFSSSGTTATIAPGAAVIKKGKPGRSKKPIQLTTLQRYDRAKRKLRSIGAPLTSSSKSAVGNAHPILEELKAKYGLAATVEPKEA